MLLPSLRTGTELLTLSLLQAASSDQNTLDANSSMQEVKHLLQNATKLPDPGQINVEKVVSELLPVVAAIAIRSIGVLFLLFVAWLFARWARRFVGASLRRAHVEQTVEKFASGLTGWTIILLALILSLAVFGVDTTVFAGILGAIGLAIGFGFQGALANLAAGAMLVVFRPFRVGDLVEIDGELGIVEEIELYFTRLNRFDNRHVIVPNDDVLSNKIENLSRNQRRRIDVPVGVDYGADPHKTREILESVISKVDGVLEDEKNAVVFMGFGDSSVNWEVRVVCNWDRWLEVRQQVLHEIWDALQEGEIVIPFPQRDVRVAQPMRIVVERSVEAEKS